MDVLQGGREQGGAGPVLKGDRGTVAIRPGPRGLRPRCTQRAGEELCGVGALPCLHLTHRHTNAMHMHMIPHTPASACLQARPLGFQCTFSGSHGGPSWGWRALVEGQIEPGHAHSQSHSEMDA